MVALTAKPLTAKPLTAKTLIARALGAGETTYSPTSLFASNEEGAFYDFSNLATLRQNENGTGLVVDWGDPVGFVVDQSKGAGGSGSSFTGLGDELISNGDFSSGVTGWTEGSSVIFTVSAGQAILELDTGDNFAQIRQELSVEVGATYYYEITKVSEDTGSSWGFGETPSGTRFVELGTTESGTKSGTFIAPASTIYLQLNVQGSAGDQTIYDNASVRKIPGNHLTQPTSTARPLLARVPVGGRRNLMTATEDLTDSAWITSNLAVSANSDGVADLIYPLSTGSARTIQQGDFSQPAGDYVASCDLKASGIDFAYIQVNFIGGDAFYVGVDLTDGSTGTPTDLVGTSASGVSASTTLVGGYYRLDVAFNKSTTQVIRFYVGVSDSTNTRDVTANGTNGVLVKRAQLEAGATATPYQRVTAAYDITESGVDSVIYPLDDTVDDALTVSMPDLGTDATRAVVNHDLTITYLENQTIGAGNIDIPLDKAAVIYRDTGFTAGEKSDLEAWALGLGQ
jgi:hypothetical protein